jgi:hypothetical protein
MPKASRMKLSMTTVRRAGLFLMLFSFGISLWWALGLGRAVPGGTIDFQGVYYGTRCLLQHCDPYRQSELESIYRAEAGEHLLSRIEPDQLQVITFYVNLPTTFLYLAPIAMLPWGLAQASWITLTAVCFFLAAFLMWRLGADYAPRVSLFLVCILLANSEVVFSTGNTAGVVVGLCVIAVWCFLQQRFVPLGILCLAISLGIKPHDAGLVWLYFLLAGGAYRKRALQTLAVTVVLGLAAILWVSHVAPHWLPEWRSNMASISSPGGLNEPSPGSKSGHGTADIIIDLQTAVSVFRDDPRIFNPVSYLVCGALLLVWTVTTLKSRFSPQRAWFALAAISPLTMLVTYHRPYDARLLLLSVPACAMLWAEGGGRAWAALVINSAAIVMTGDIPVALLTVFTWGLHWSTASLPGKVMTVALIRPVPLILLAMAIFYLWVYMRRGPDECRTDEPGDPGQDAIAGTKD